MQVLPLPEPGHQGYLVLDAKRALVIDPPLDTETVTEFLPGWVQAQAVVETAAPDWRVAGGRPLAEAVGATLYGPGIRGARPLRAGSRIDGVPEAGVVAAPGLDANAVAIVIGDLVFVGDLDGGAAAASAEAADRVAASRADLARRFADRPAHGSAGVRPAADLAALPPPRVGPPPVNADAVRMTNEGHADMYWADPRFQAPAAPVGRSYLEGRAGSPWSPTVLDLRSAGGDDPPDAVRMPPARLASEIGRLESSREVVVLADDPATAEAAAGFLRRLGMNASWAR